MWNKQPVFSGKQPADLKEYPSVEEVKDAWMEGKMQAKAVAASLEMTDMDVAEVYIDQPENDMDNMRTEEEQREVNVPTENDEFTTSCSTDVDSVSARESLENIIGSLERDGNEGELAPEESNEPNIQSVAVQSQIAVPGVGLRYKSMVVSEINSSPHTAWDRLQRVRQRNFSTINHTDVNENCLSLLDDCAYRVNDGFKILQVCRLRKKGRSRGYIEYQMPVSFESADKNDIEVVGNLYQGRCSEMQKGALITITFKQVITVVRLEFDPVKATYTLNSDDEAKINSALAPRSRGPRSSTVVNDDNDVDETGMIRAVIAPDVIDDNIPRSARSRVQRYFTT